MLGVYLTSGGSTSTMQSIVDMLKAFFTALFSTTSGSEGVLVQLFNWLTSSTVLPFFGIGIAISLTLLTVKIIRSVIYGV